MNIISPPFQAVFFDLDGTLVHTEPAITLAINDLRAELNMAPLLAEAIRPHISYGAARMATALLNCEENHPQFKQLNLAIHARCEQRLNSDIRLFYGIEMILQHLENQSIPWGIVTNRYEHSTFLLLDKLQLNQRCAAVVCGDTLPRAKPYPDPLLHACKLLQKAPEHCLFIGDAVTDIEAGQKAKMTTLAASYGYRGETENPNEWGAHGLVHAPVDILSWLS
ncbi:MAG: HAD family hydrolase [Gammaproteobacteria bacterium]